MYCKFKLVEIVKLCDELVTNCFDKKTATNKQTICSDAGIRELLPPNV